MKIHKEGHLSTYTLANTMLTIIAFSLGFGLWFATPHGLGLTPDSVAYLKATQGLNQGFGFEYFSMQWPPGYSSLIYLLGLLTGGDYISSARFINAVTYSLLFYTLAKVLETTCRMKLIEAAILAILICLHPVVTYIFFYTLSEPIFLLTVLINFVLLINCLRDNKPLSSRSKFYLIIIGCLAVSFRYAGLTVVALNVWFVVYQSDTRLMKINRLLDVLLQSVPALLLVSIWRLHRGIGDTEANERPLVLHLVTFEDMRYGFIKIGNWFISPLANKYDDPYEQFAYFTGFIICGLFLVLFVWSNKQSPIKKFCSKPLSRQKLITKYIWILSTYICGYIAFLIIIRSLFDPNIVLDNRTLSPIVLSVFIALIVSFYLFKKTLYRNIAILILIIAMISQIHNLKTLVLLSYYNGIELNDKNFKTRSINIFLKSCDKNIKIAADKPWSFNLSFLTMVYWLPQYFLYGSGLQNKRYFEQINELVNTQDLIVIEAVNSEIVKSIDALNAFNRIYSGVDGVVWQNIRIKSRICLNSL